MKLEKVSVNKSFQIEMFENAKFVVVKEEKNDLNYYRLLLFPPDEENLKVEWDVIPSPPENRKDDLEKYFAEKVTAIINTRVDEYGMDRIKVLIKHGFESVRQLHFLNSQETKKKFKDIFGFVMPINPTMKDMNIPYFDVIKFDKLIETPDGISTKDYVTTVYGKEACEFIESLL